MNLALLRSASCALVLVAFSSRAHSPLETSTRAIVRENTLELALTVGTEAGAKLLEGQPPDAFRPRPVGPGFALPKDFAVTLFELSSGNAALLPNKLEVRTDGLEFNFALEYPRPVTNEFGVRANYLTRLPSLLKSSFVLTDENGNILATRVVKQGDGAFERALPAGAGAAVTGQPSETIHVAQLEVARTETPPIQTESQVHLASAATKSASRRGAWLLVGVIGSGGLAVTIIRWRGRKT